MKRLIATVTLAAAALGSMRLAAAAAQDNQPPLDPRVVQWDKGVDKIDVSKYSPEMKEKYKVFADVCSQCHSLARAVNCDFALEDDWERYIKRMMRRGRSLVTSNQALTAYEFAVYDSKIRKKALYDRKLKEATR